MNLKMLKSFNNELLESKKMAALVEARATELFGDQATELFEKVQSIWDKAPTSTKQLDEASMAATSRAGEIDWTRPVDSGRTYRSGVSKPSGQGEFGNTGITFGEHDPGVGDVVMMGRGGGVGKIVDIDPPKGPVKAMIIKSGAGEKLFKRDQLVGPKIIRTKSGKRVNAWMLT